MTMDEAAVGRVLREVAEQAAGAAPAASSAPVLDHIVQLVSPLLAAANFEEDVWDQVRSRCPPSVPPLRAEVGRYFAREMGRCAEQFEAPPGSMPLSKEIIGTVRSAFYNVA